MEVTKICLHWWNSNTIFTLLVENKKQLQKEKKDRSFCLDHSLSSLSELIEHPFWVSIIEVMRNLPLIEGLRKYVISNCGKGYCKHSNHQAGEE